MSPHADTEAHTLACAGSDLLARTHAHTLQEIGSTPRHMPTFRHREPARRSHQEQHETEEVPRLCASPGLVSTTARATYSCWHDTGSHCAARPRVQWGPISSLSPPHCLAAWGWEPSCLFQRVRETAQRLCVRNPGGTLF